VHMLAGEKSRTHYSIIHSISQSINQPPSPLDTPGTEAFASELHNKNI